MRFLVLIALLLYCVGSSAVRLEGEALTHAAFECSAIADWEGKGADDAQEAERYLQESRRLLRLGIRSGRVFIEALAEVSGSKQIVTVLEPTSVGMEPWSWAAAEGAHDFILGAWTPSRCSAAPSDALALKAWYCQQRDAYDKKNCALLK